MGEWSKAVGEFGEETVENFLKLIGWGNVPKGLQFECRRQKDHADDSERRTTHGIDFFYSYLSPLADSTLKNIHISSKYTSNPYPNSPIRLFKEYCQDIAWAIDCFRFSQKKSDLISSFKGYNRVDDVGVIFWLSNQESYDDLCSKLLSISLNIDGVAQSIYVVDNKRISFIYQSIKYVKGAYPSQSLDFFYPNTGKNINPIQKKDFGTVLPVEYINSSILPIRTEDESGKTCLVLLSIDPFSKTDLSRLIGLAQDLSKSWSSAVDISFPDYNGLSHEVEVREIKRSFEDTSFINKVKVTSYSNSFVTINQ